MVERKYHYGETVYGMLSGVRRRCIVIRQSPEWTKVCIGFSGHCTAIYSRVKTKTILPLPASNY